MNAAFESFYSWESNRKSNFNLFLWQIFFNFHSNFSLRTPSTLWNRRLSELKRTAWCLRVWRSKSEWSVKLNWNFSLIKQLELPARCFVFNQCKSKKCKKEKIDEWNEKFQYSEWTRDLFFALYRSSIDIWD